MRGEEGTDLQADAGRVPPSAMTHQAHDGPRPSLPARAPPLLRLRSARGVAAVVGRLGREDGWVRCREAVLGEGRLMAARLTSRFSPPGTALCRPRHDPLSPFSRYNQIDQRVADIAPDKGSESAFSENLADQGGRRGLAVGPGDSRNRRVDEFVGQLNLADNRDAPVPGQRQRCDIHRHTRAHHDQVRGKKCLIAMPAELIGYLQG